MNKNVVEKTLQSIDNIDRLTDLAAISIYNTSYEALDKYDIMQEHATPEYVNEEFIQESVLAGVLIGAGIIGVAVSAFFIIKKIIDSGAKGDKSKKDSSPVAGVDLTKPEEAKKFLTSKVEEIKKWTEGSKVTIKHTYNKVAATEIANKIKAFSEAMVAVIDANGAEDIKKATDTLNGLDPTLPALLEEKEQPIDKTTNLFDLVDIECFTILAEAYKELEKRVADVEKQMKNKTKKEGAAEETEAVDAELQKTVKEKCNQFTNNVAKVIKDERGWMEELQTAVHNVQQAPAPAKEEPAAAESKDAAKTETPAASDASPANAETQAKVSNNGNGMSAEDAAYLAKFKQDAEELNKYENAEAKLTPGNPPLNVNSSTSDNMTGQIIGAQRADAKNNKGDVNYLPNTSELDTAQLGNISASTMASTETPDKFAVDDSLRRAGDKQQARETMPGVEKTKEQIKADQEKAGLSSIDEKRDLSGVEKSVADNRLSELLTNGDKLKDMFAHAGIDVNKNDVKFIRRLIENMRDNQGAGVRESLVNMRDGYLKQNKDAAFINSRIIGYYNICKNILNYLEIPEDYIRFNVSEILVDKQKRFLVEKEDKNKETSSDEPTTEPTETEVKTEPPIPENTDTDDSVDNIDQHDAIDTIVKAAEESGSNEDEIKQKLSQYGFSDDAINKYYNKKHQDAAIINNMSTNLMLGTSENDVRDLWLKKGYSEEDVDRWIELAKQQSANNPAPTKEDTDKYNLDESMSEDIIKRLNKGETEEAIRADLTNKGHSDEDINRWMKLGTKMQKMANVPKTNGFDFDYAQNANGTFTVPDVISSNNPKADMTIVSKNYNSIMNEIKNGAEPETIEDQLNRINNLGGSYTPETKKALFEAVKMAHPSITIPGESKPELEVPEDTQNEETFNANRQNVGIDSTIQNIRNIVPDAKWEDIAKTLKTYGFSDDEINSRAPSAEPQETAENINLENKEAALTAPAPTADNVKEPQPLDPNIEAGKNAALRRYMLTNTSKDPKRGYTAASLTEDIDKAIAQAQMFKNKGVAPANAKDVKKALYNIYKKTGGNGLFAGQDRKSALSAAKNYAKYKMTESGVGDYFFEMIELDAAYQQLIMECDIAIAREEKLKLITEQK